MQALQATGSFLLSIEDRNAVKPLPLMSILVMRFYLVMSLPAMSLGECEQKGWEGVQTT